MRIIFQVVGATTKQLDILARRFHTRLCRYQGKPSGERRRVAVVSGGVGGAMAFPLKLHNWVLWYILL